MSSNNTAMPGKGCVTLRPTDSLGHLRIAADLCHQIRFIDTNTRNSEVFDLFDGDSTLLSLPVLDEKRIVGVIDRETFMHGMVKRYHWELYANKRCTRMMDDAPVVVDADATVRDVANLLFGNGTTYAIPETFIVARAGVLVGTGCTSDVIAAILEHERVASEELRRHHDRLSEMVEERTHDLMLAKQVAEQANRAKSDFLATMSHEIRTPLNAVVGLTGLLADSHLDRRQRDYAYKILSSAQALRALIDNILDFSKIEAGGLKLEQAPFSLNAILRTTAAVVLVGARDKPIEALFDVAPDVPDALIGDALRLQQILLNLTGNAVKFTAAGDIVITVRCLAWKARQVTLQFSVRDTGIGIAPEHLKQIFEIFTQADSSISRQYGGSGLGLAISARLADLMSGQIVVASTARQGSEFCFTVPLALANGERAAALENHLPGLRILIIDDHPLARQIVKQTCVAFNWQVTALDSGAAGLIELRRSAAEGREYDLLLLDWHMPGMSGLDMLRHARATPGVKLPQVVLMATTFELEQAFATCDELHLDGIVAKPATPATLFEAVRRAHYGEFVGVLPSQGKTDHRLAGLRLLVAEDNELNQQVIEQILTRAGAKVVMAANGRIAVEALQAPGARFDAVLMDIQMPVMDGYSATRVIREEMGLCNLPIIAVTAHAQPEDREQSRRAGMVGHIVKPIDVDDLLNIVTEERRGMPGLPADRPLPATKQSAFRGSMSLPR